MEEQMKKMMTGQWWVLLVRGILAVLFGIIAISNVQATALILFIWFVFYAISDGILNVYMSFMHRHDTHRWWLGFVTGMISILFGLAAFVWPQLTALLLLIFIAVRAIIEGISMVVTAIQVRQEVKGEWLLILGGIIALIFGIWMLFHPVIGGLALLWVIGIYALVFGVILIIQAFRMRRLGTTAPAA